MKIIVFALLLSASLPTKAQQDSTKVEQYCQVLATGRLLSSKVTIDIDYGEERSIWKDNRLKNDEGRLKKFNTVIDALNYLGKNGWKLVNAFPVSTGNGPMFYHYVFKKDFLPSQAEE